MSGLTNGKWIAVSLTGASVPPGYYHYTTLTIASLKDNNCDLGTFALEIGEILDQQVGREEEKESVPGCVRVCMCVVGVERTLPRQQSNPSPCVYVCDCHLAGFCAKHLRNPTTGRPHQME